jgi:hypothetical protein
MQHWHIYRKWNANLFKEMYKAYIEGRAEKDPSEFWYEGEMDSSISTSFLLQEAQNVVYSVSRTTNANYAEKNRSSGGGRKWSPKWYIVEEGQHDAQRPAFKRSGLGLD